MEDFRPVVEHDDDDEDKITPKKRGFLNSWLEQYRDSRYKTEEEDTSEEDDDDKEKGIFSTNKRWKRFFGKLFDKVIASPSIILENKETLMTIPPDNAAIKDKTEYSYNNIASPGEELHRYPEDTSPDLYKDTDDGREIYQEASGDMTEEVTLDNDKTEQLIPDNIVNIATRKNLNSDQEFPLYVRGQEPAPADFTSARSVEENFYKSSNKRKITKLKHNIDDNYREFKKENNATKKEIKKLKNTKLEKKVNNLNVQEEEQKHEPRTPFTESTRYIENNPKDYERINEPQVEVKIEHRARPIVVPEDISEKVITTEQNIDAYTLPREKNKESLPNGYESKKAPVRELLEQIEKVEKHEDYIEKNHEKRHEVKDKEGFLRRPVKVGDILPRVPSLTRLRSEHINTGKRDGVPLSTALKEAISNNQSDDMYSNAVRSGFYVAVALIIVGFIVIIINGANK